MFRIRLVTKTGHAFLNTGFPTQQSAGASLKKLMAEIDTGDYKVVYHSDGIWAFNVDEFSFAEVEEY